MTAPISLLKLEQIIRSAWCAETAWTPEAWSGDDPAAGQCFSTAYVIKSLLGGKIVHLEILPHTQPKQRHAWNVFDNGLEIDRTREQFSVDQRFLPCELPEDLVWSCGGKQAEWLLAKVMAQLSCSSFLHRQAGAET